MYFDANISLTENIGGKIKSPANTQAYSSNILHD